MDAAWPEVDGPVDALAADGTGGWFIGGNFAHVGSRPRRGLAHIGAGGTLDLAWAPTAPNGAVQALAVNEGTVYVGGDFSAIGREHRGRLPLSTASAAGSFRGARTSITRCTLSQPQVD